MNDTTLLLGLVGVRVERVVRDADGTRVVTLRTDDAAASACPGCGVFSTSLKGRAVTRPRDLPYGEEPLRLRWCKSRFRAPPPGLAPGRAGGSLLGLYSDDLMDNDKVEERQLVAARQTTSSVTLKWVSRCSGIDGPRLVSQECC